MRILIVENDGDTREMLESLCDARGIEWASAGRADAAMELLAGTAWDGLILDVDLRNGHGAISALQAIRDSRSLAELVVIVTTALPRSDSVVIDALSRADDLIFKPYTFESILDV